MKRSKFTENQKAFILNQAEDGTPSAEVCRNAGISEATFCNWRHKSCGRTPSEMKRLSRWTYSALAMQRNEGQLKTLCRWKAGKVP